MDFGLALGLGTKCDLSTEHAGIPIALVLILLLNSEEVSAILSTP